MQGIINGSMLVGFLRMLRQVDSRVFILTEGPEDAVVLDPHLDSREAFVYPGSGKSSVLAAAQEIEDEGLELMFCVVDRDCDGVLGRDVYPAPCCASESYDMAMDLLRAQPEVLERMAISHSDRVKLSRYMQDRHATSVFEVAVDVVSTLSVLRLASESHTFALRLADFPIRELLEAHEGGLNPDATIELACRRTPGGPLPNIVRSAWDAHDQGIDDVSLITNGHNVLHAAAEIIRTHAGATLARKVFEASVIGAINCATIVETTIFRELDARAAAHGRSIWTCAA